MQKIIRTTLFSFCFSLFLLMSSQVVAATTPASKSASNNASPSASPEETTLELKKRIEKVVEEKRDQIKGVISNLLSDKKGFLGEVSRLSGEALTIKRQNGDTIILPLTEKIIILKANKKITAEDIEVGNTVTIVGYESNDQFMPEFILVSTAARPKSKQVLLGTITAIARGKFTIKARGAEEEKVYIIPTKAKFENVDGATLKVTDFDEDIAVLVIATENDKNQLELSTIRALTDVRAVNNER